MCLYIYIYIHTYVYTHIHTYACLYTYIHTYTHIYVLLKNILLLLRHFFPKTHTTIEKDAKEREELQKGEQ